MEKIMVHSWPWRVLHRLGALLERGSIGYINGPDTLPAPLTREEILQILVGRHVSDTIKK